MRTLRHCADPGAAVSVLVFVCSGWIQVRAGEVTCINVKDFGAKGDGSTDDTEAIRKAFEAAQKTLHGGQYPGSAYSFSASEVFFPHGLYIISDVVPLGGQTFRGEGHAIIRQTKPDKDIFYSGGAWRMTFRNLTFQGGKIHLNLGNPNIDRGLFLIDDCKFQKSSGPAIQVRKGSNSTFTQIEHCQFVHCRQVLITHTDGTTMRNCWISGGLDQGNRAVIENRSGNMLLENILAAPHPSAVEQRWVDNHSLLTCRNCRFGGEFGGFTPVYNFAKYNTQAGGAKVIIEDSWVSAESSYKGHCAVYCVEVPNMVIVRNCNLTGVPPIKVSKKIDLKNYFRNVRPGMLQFRSENNIGELGDAVPELLAHPVVIQDDTEGPPQLSLEETDKLLAEAVAF